MTGCRGWPDVSDWTFPIDPPDITEAGEWAVPILPPSQGRFNKPETMEQPFESEVVKTLTKAVATSELDRYLGLRMLLLASPRGPTRQHSLHHLTSLSEDGQAMMSPSAQSKITLDHHNDPPATTPKPPTTCGPPPPAPGSRRVAARMLPSRAPLLVEAMTGDLRGHQQKALCPEIFATHLRWCRIRSAPVVWAWRFVAVFIDKDVQMSL